MAVVVVDVAAVVAAVETLVLRAPVQIQKRSYPATAQIAPKAVAVEAVPCQMRPGFG